MTRSDRSASACYILLKGSLFFLICLSALCFIAPTLAQEQTPTPEPTPTPTPARLIRRLRDLVVQATPTPTPTPPPLSPIRTFPIMVELPTPAPSTATPTPTPKNLLKTKTYVIPHIIERTGTITNAQFTFDTTLFATYTAGLAGTPAGPGATIDLYLCDNSTGTPLRNNATVVCDPCSYNFGGTSPRKQSIRIDDLITAKGGSFDAAVKLGFGVVVVQGDADNLSLHGFITNSHTSAFDLSVADFEPIPLVSPKATRFLIPHIIERTGTITNAQFTFDTTLFATYTAGLAGTPAGPGATIDLYLCDNSTGTPLRNNATVVCDPCSYNFGGTSPRKQSIRIDDLITAKGGSFDAAVKLGFGVVVVQGDADNLSLQGFITNSHTSAFDLSLSEFKVIPLDAP